MAAKRFFGFPLFLTCGFAVAALSVKAQSYTFTTLAGNPGYGSADGTGSAAQFYQPVAVAADGSGGVYVADTANSTIRRIAPGGVVTTFAGQAGSLGYVNGVGVAARFSSPNGIAVDGFGNVYVGDTYNYVIRKITPAGVVTTFAGSGTPGSANGTGGAASFGFPEGLAVDNNNNVYVADTDNDTIRKITPAGVVTTLAGSAGVIGSADGTGAAAQFFYPSGVAVDGSGNVFVADTLNSTIRMITSAGVVTTLAGTAGSPGSADGTGAAAEFDEPAGIAVDSVGNVYVADTDNDIIRQIVVASTVVTTIAGTAFQQGSLDGMGSMAEFNQPKGVAVVNSGLAVVADAGNSEIRTFTLPITSGGTTVSTLAGTASAGSVDATGSAARFDQPSSVAVDGDGTVYVADMGNDTIRMVTASGVVTTLAGSPGVFGSSDGTGSAANFGNPAGVALDSDGTIYVADAANETIRAVTSTGVVTTFAGSAGGFGSSDGMGSAASFYDPSGVAVDAMHNVYVADTGNNTIRMITPMGVVTTLAGTAGVTGSADGTGGAASFYNPVGVAVDGAGYVYVADTQNETIRKISPAGVVSTLAGTPGVFGATDGTGSAASFWSPSGVAVDRDGIVYVADSDNFTIRKITPGGVVTTIGGTGFTPGSVDGPGAIALFGNPTGIAVANSTGDLYVADQGNNTIRMGVPGSPGLTLVPMGWENSQFKFNAIGPNALAMQVQVSSDLMNWEPLTSVTPFTGTASLVDSFTPGPSPRFYRGVLMSPPAVTKYVGTGLVMVGYLPAGYGPGATVTFTGGSGSGAFTDTVTADANGLYTFDLDTSEMPDSETIYMSVSSANGMVVNPPIPLTIDRTYTYSPSDEAPANLAMDDYGPIEPDICSCCSCLDNSSCLFYGNSFTPSDPGTDLATGKLRLRFPILSFQTREQGFNFRLTYASLVNYSGVMGNGFSHSYNMMIVQSNAAAGQIVTPDLRVYSISSTDGINWQLPAGFESALTLNTNMHRWTLTHYSGFQVQFYQAKSGSPGYPVTISDANGNTTSLAYDSSGLLQSITTDLGQTETISYNVFGQLASLTDHIGRTWMFNYDFSNRLTQIVSPVTQYANVPAGSEVIDTTLAGALVTRGRTTTLAYANTQYPNDITSITDDRGAVPQSWVYDSQGRVVTNFINGNPEIHIYGPTAGPAPLQKLDAANLITRNIDREGNVTDYEIHSRAGGPDGGAGQFGLRRKVIWTATGIGNTPLRPGEPSYYEERLLQDCDCLSPHIVAQLFSSADAATLSFDSNGIPMNWPRSIYTYNTNRQVTTNLYTDGTSSIQTTMTYQDNGFGQSSQFSRVLTRTDPRAYDTNPIYAGLSFVHSYQYDGFGNQISHSAPTVTRGAASAQAITETWTYNSYGQKLSYTDPNRDITTYAYYSGESTGGDINTAGGFGGYLATITSGAAGSGDSVTDQTTAHKVNSLGMVTEMQDPRGLVTDYQYDNLGEQTVVTDPYVTLWTGQQVRYTTAFVYDGAGNVVMSRRANIDYDGKVPGNATVDRSKTYDAVNNLLSERQVVDANHADDLITYYAYNSNDLRIVTQKPQGNRKFELYDERLLPFKSFYGVAPGSQVTSGYPTSKQATNLGGTSFVGYTQANYDSRKNLVQWLDGRGNLTYAFFDFYNRRFAQSDPNGNGGTTAYDAAGNALTIQAGPVSQATGTITQVLSRQYQRFDEDNRQYQTVLDINLASDESSLVNPATSGNSSYSHVFDPGSRVSMSMDANGNSTYFTYDADNRRLAVADALGDNVKNTYDQDGNVVALSEVEVPGPGAVGAAQTYVTTFSYDGNNRRTNTDIQGLNGNSINDQTLFAYDSRGNVRLMEDADANFTLTTLDYQNRTTLIQRFDGDPTSGTPNELSQDGYVYDMNSRKTEDQSFSTAANPASIQITQYGYDNADRLVQTVYPDSYGVEVAYDANANAITMEDQRQVVFNYTYDPGNRLTRQSIALPTGVPGVSQQQFGYDARNLLTSAMNNYASVSRSFDALRRLTNETQSIRLDGSGFTNGWEQPVSLLFGYDGQSNQTNRLVVAGTSTDLSISRNIDALNRCQSIHAQYFNITNSPVATYNFFGPGRIQTKILGNGAEMTNTYDVKRRLSTLQWLTPASGLLVGFEYGYDSMDNPLYERWLHDNGDYDYYQYNHRYEVTGVAYRSSSSVAPASFPTTFAYNDNLDRTQATFGGPFSAQPTNMDAYTINTSDEYIGLTRNGVVLTPGYDKAGNMTNVPVLPVTDVTAQADVNALAEWDAFNCLFSISTSVTPAQNYRYDPFRRRIATLSGSSTTPVRRFIYDGWTPVEERLFNSDATPASAPSTLERIYVDGRELDEHLLTAIDRNGNGILGPANLNASDTNADQWYYFLPNGLGSVTALLAANNPNQTLEYYRYTAYGEATVLPALSVNTNLALNFAQGWQRSSPEHGNYFFFTGQRFDDQTGLYYYRNRFYEGRGGRFVSRDPLGQAGGPNRFQFAGNNPTSYTDPLGLWSFDFGGPSAPTPPNPARTTTFSDDTEWTLAASLLAFYHAGDDPYGNIGHYRYDWDSVIIEGDPIDRVQQQDEVIAGQDSANIQLAQDAKALVPFLACGESATFVDRGHFQAMMNPCRLLLIGAFGTSSIYWEAHCQIGPKACCAPDSVCDSGKRDNALYNCLINWTLYKIYNFGETGTGTGGGVGLFLKKLSHALQANQGTTFNMFGYWQTSTGGRAKGDCCAPPCTTGQCQTGNSTPATTTGTGTQSK